jgi:peptide/nickel transport system permease protein
VVALFVVSVVVFAGTEVLPGDAARAFLGPRTTAARLGEVRKELHLDEPAPIRYVHWLIGAARGDLGVSIASTDRRPVVTVIGDRVLNSALIGVPAAILMVLMAVVLGVVAALRADRGLDRVISVTALGLLAVPEFVTGTILVLVFALGLSLLPASSLIPYQASPLQRPQILILPILTLLLVSLAQNVRLVRANMIEALRSEYVEAARLNGVEEWLITWRYALPNGLAPAVPMLARYVAYLVGGAVVVESLFGYGGVGPAFVQAVAERDVPVVQGISMLAAALTIGTNLVADLVTLALLPGARTRQAR